MSCRGGACQGTAKTCWGWVLLSILSATTKDRGRKGSPFFLHVPSAPSADNAAVVPADKVHIGLHPSHLGKWKVDAEVRWDKIKLSQLKGSNK